MRTVEEIVHMGTGLEFQQPVQASVNRRQILVGQPAPRNAALVRNDKDLQSGIIEPANRGGGAIQEAKLLWGLYVPCSARRLDIDGAVAIQKGDARRFQDIAQSSLSTNSKIVCPASMWPSWIRAVFAPGTEMT